MTLFTAASLQCGDVLEEQCTTAVEERWWADEQTPLGAMKPKKRSRDQSTQHVEAPPTKLAATRPPQASTVNAQPKHPAGGVGSQYPPDTSRGRATVVDTENRRRATVGEPPLSSAQFGAWTQHTTPNVGFTEQKVVASVACDKEEEEAAAALGDNEKEAAASVVAFSYKIDVANAEQTRVAVQAVATQPANLHWERDWEQAKREEEEANRMKEIKREMQRAEARQKVLFAEAAKRHSAAANRAAPCREGFSNVEQLSVEVLVRQVLQGAKGGSRGALGISSAASCEEIKKRFCSLALRLHPDKTKYTNASEAFTAVQDAYDKLRQR